MKTLLAAILIAMSFNATAAHMQDDKAKHMTGSAVIGGLAQYAFDDTTAAMATCMGVGLGKELYDQYDYGGFDAKDLVADGLGCAIGIAGVKAITISIEDDVTSINYQIKF